MKLTKETISLLKSMSSMNQGIIIRPGNTLRTMTPTKNVMMEAGIEEDITSKVAIYDLPKFLKAISVLTNPEVEFQQEHILISSGNRRIKWLYSDESIITAPPQRELVMPSVDATLTLSAYLLNDLKKAAQVLEKEDILVKGDGKDISVSVVDKNLHSSTFEADIIASETDKVFDVYFKASNLAHLIVGSYEVELSKSNLAKFQHTTKDVTYYIAIQPNSTWDLELVEAPAEEPAKAPQKKVKKEAVAA